MSLIQIPTQPSLIKIHFSIHLSLQPSRGEQEAATHRVHAMKSARSSMGRRRNCAWRGARQKQSSPSAWCSSSFWVWALEFILTGSWQNGPSRASLRKSTKRVSVKIMCLTSTFRVNETFSVQDQGLALEWIDDYHPVPICHIHRERRCRWILSGINLRVNVSVRQRYCEANGRTFDAEVYNTLMADPNPEGEFERDYDVYISARCQDGQEENTHPLMDPPPYSNTEV